MVDKMTHLRDQAAGSGGCSCANPAATRRWASVSLASTDPAADAGFVIVGRSVRRWQDQHHLRRDRPLETGMLPMVELSPS
jgi:hypothetical protein